MKSDGSYWLEMLNLATSNWSSHNLEYFKPIGYHLRNVASIVATRVNRYTRHTGLSQWASVTNMGSY